jgi:hypothetical protein
LQILGKHRFCVTVGPDSPDSEFKIAALSVLFHVRLGYAYGP